MIIYFIKFNVLIYFKFIFYIFDYERDKQKKNYET